MGVSENSGTPKMDGENDGKPYCLMDDLGGKPSIFGNIHTEPTNHLGGGFKHFSDGLKPPTMYSFMMLNHTHPSSSFLACFVFERTRGTRSTGKGWPYVRNPNEDVHMSHA